MSDGSIQDVILDYESPTTRAYFQVVSIISHRRLMILTFPWGTACGYQIDSGRRAVSYVESIPNTVDIPSWYLVLLG